MGFECSIFIVEIAFNPTFWASVIDKVSQFYLAWVLPLFFEDMDELKESSFTYGSLQPIQNVKKPG